MPNHLHLIVYTRNSERTINKIIGSGKRFMAYEIVERLEKSGRDDLLKLMSDAVVPSERQRNKKHEVFEDSFDCKEIVTEKFIRQKLNYIHKNPVSGKWKLAEHYLEYVYSSARFYDLGEKSNCSLFHFADINPSVSPRKED
jgi:REP element-mobilizing transposase RayT